MRKMIVLFMALVVFFGATLCGCASSAKIEELEKRVAYLESVIADTQTAQSNESSSNNHSMSNGGTTVSNEEETSAISIVETSLADQTGQTEYAWLLNGMTNDEIVGLCSDIMSNVPLKGQSYDEYRESLKIQPLQEDSLNKLYYYYVSLYANDNNLIDQEAIILINAQGTQTEMDGSIGYNQNGWSVNVIVKISVDGYEKASDIYDKLYNLLSPVYEPGADYQNMGYEMIDKRDSTVWNAYGPVIVPNGSGTGATISTTEFLRMEKADNLYIITATRAYIPQSIEN